MQEETKKKVLTERPGWVTGMHTWVQGSRPRSGAGDMCSRAARANSCRAKCWCRPWARHAEPTPFMLQLPDSTFSLSTGLLGCCLLLAGLSGPAARGASAALPPRWRSCVKAGGLMIDRGGAFFWFRCSFADFHRPRSC